MSSHDAIEISLSRPMAWEVFESLVFNVLISDDLPSLRKLGGGNDWGLDAESIIYLGEGAAARIAVQVTSQQAQVGKFTKTINRLREKGIDFEHLVMVYRAPVSSETRREIQRHAKDLNVTVDSRDSTYLVSQLGKHPNIYKRFFASFDEQVIGLLQESDALAAIESPQKRALLATLACYVNNPKAALAKSTLFERTILAATVTVSPGATVHSILKVAKVLLPEETIDSARISSALDTLRAEGSIKVQGDKVEVSGDMLVAIGGSIAKSKSAAEDIISSIIGHCKRLHKLSQAQAGYLERNTKVALLSFIRRLGPIDGDEAVKLDEANDGLNALFARDLPPELSRSAIAALSSYVSSPKGRANLGLLTRNYSALALRNLDPVGRRWQASVLSRTMLVLDTDVVLRLLVDDLPEHRTVHGAVAALQRRGMKVVVPEVVLQETIDSISRGANTTFNKFSGTLDRLSDEMAEGMIWNAVVRGFHYAKKKKAGLSWPHYHTRYWDEERPAEYLMHVLRQRLPSITTLPLDEIPLPDTPALEEAVSQLLKKERARPKAAYRSEEAMRVRIYRDVKVLYNLASAGKVLSEPIGYFFSSDWRLHNVESTALWQGKAPVWQPSAALPHLAALIAGFEASDDALVQLLFNPIIAAATESMREELDGLIRVGVSVRDTPLERLEWDLKQALGEQLRSYFNAREAGDEDELGDSALELVATAANQGYPVEPAIKKAAENFKATVLERDALISAVDEARKEATAIAGAFLGSSKKGRKRFRKALTNAGLDPEKYLAALQLRPPQEHGDRQTNPPTAS